MPLPWGWCSMTRTPHLVCRRITSLRPEGNKPITRTPIRCRRAQLTVPCSVMTKAEELRLQTTASTFGLWYDGRAQHPGLSKISPMCSTFCGSSARLLTLISRCVSPPCGGEKVCRHSVVLAFQTFTVESDEALTICCVDDARSAVNMQSLM